MFGWHGGQQHQPDILDGRDAGADENPSERSVFVNAEAGSTSQEIATAGMLPGRAAKCPCRVFGFGDIGLWNKWVWKRRIV